MDFTNGTWSLLEDIILEHGKAAKFLSVYGDKAVKSYKLLIQQNEEVENYNVLVYFYFENSEVGECEQDTELSLRSVEKSEALLYADALVLYLKNLLLGSVIDMDLVDRYVEELTTKFGTAKEYLSGSSTPLSAISHFHVSDELGTDDDEHEIKVLISFIYTPEADSNKDLSDILDNLDNKLEEDFHKAFDHHNDTEKINAYFQALHLYFCQTLKSRPA